MGIRVRVFNFLIMLMAEESYNLQEDNFEDELGMSIDVDTLFHIIAEDHDQDSDPVQVGFEEISIWQIA